MESTWSFLKRRAATQASHVEADSDTSRADVESATMENNCLKRNVERLTAEATKL
jgi:hypothetical protein